MSISQTTFSDNKQIAFIQLSRPNQLFDRCWAEEGQRVMLVGVRKGEKPDLRRSIGEYAEKGTYVEEGCLGTNITGVLKFIISSEPSKVRGFFQSLEDKGIITGEEHMRAGHELGLRRRAVSHAAESSHVAEAGAFI